MGEIVVGECSGQVERSSCAARHVEAEVYEEVVGLGGSILSKVVADEVAPIVVLIIAVVAARSIGV